MNEAEGAHEERHQGRDVLGPATARNALALDLVLRPRTVPGGGQAASPCGCGFGAFPGRNVVINGQIAE